MSLNISTHVYVVNKYEFSQIRSQTGNLTWPMQISLVSLPFLQNIS